MHSCPVPEIRRKARITVKSTGGDISPIRLPCTLRPSLGVNTVMPLLRASPLLWAAGCLAQMDVQTFQKTYAEAIANTRAGEWSAAVGLWRAVTAEKPYNASLANNLATALFRSKDYRAAAAG